MSKTKYSKLRLLQGASAILALSASLSVAHAQNVQIGSTADVENIDGVMASDQSNDANVTANATNTDTTTDAGDLTNGSIAAGGGLTGSLALGNLDTISFTDAGAASLSTSMAMVANQLNTGDIDANTTSTTVSVTATDVDGSALTLSGTTDTASATGNAATQNLMLGATGLTLGTASALADTTDGNVEVTGKAIVASDQTNTGADITATTSGSTIEIEAAEVSNSTLSVGANTQTATATGSTATNGISLSGTDLGIGVAVVSRQTNDVTSSVAADTEGSVSLSATDDVDSSALSVTGNRLLSQATGATTANTLSATATNVTLAAPDGAAGAVVDSDGGTAAAGFAILNDQLVNSTTSATTTTETGVSAFSLAVDGNADSSMLTNDGNTASARAQGIVTVNAATLSVAATLDAGVGADETLANAVSIASVQTQGGDADVTAEVTTTGTGNNLVQTDVTGGIDNSSLTASSNRITATAEGANATNTLVASATNLSATGGEDGLPYLGMLDGTATVDAAFSVLNVQNAGANTVEATIGDMATVEINVDGNITDSSVVSNGNIFSALAGSNKSANALSLSGTVVETSAGLLNAQDSAAAVSASIGSDNDAGVVIMTDGDISDSMLAVTGNIVQGSAVANSSNNQLAVSATTLNGVGTGDYALAEGYAAAGTTLASLNAEADFALGNLQTAGGSSTTEIFSTFGIDQIYGGLLEDSRLSVSNNSQFGEALANTSTNRLTLSATDTGAGITPTAALSSMQQGTAVNIDSTSDMNVYVSAASSGSSITLSGNSNTALGVVNNAGNTLAVSGTNIYGERNGSAYAGAEAQGDFALNSWQQASGTLDSSATTSLYNLDRTLADNLGTDGSSVSFAGNSTTAEASANRVANAVSVNATAETNATAALNNTQISGTTVNATATSSVAYVMTADETLYPADSSTVSIDGNTTASLARGNTANNTMTYTAGATYTGYTGGSYTDISGVTSASATAAMLNNQSNSGAVTALSQNASYSLTLNGTDAAGAALNSAASVTNNATTAAAYGNSAVNTLAMYTFSSGVPSAALSSIQSNSGAVMATASSASYGVQLTGVLDGSAIRNTGNVVTAQAVGNSSISTITGGN